MVQLTSDLLELLDRRSAHEGVSRSQLIREAIEAFLAQDREREISRQIVEGYTRMPQGGEYDVDEWGDLGKTVTALTVESLRRLEEEDGMPARCAVSLDNLGEAWKAMLADPVTMLGHDRMREVCQALNRALAC